ncbi:hypothetical protein [Parasediminibacterium sp. JCM 36343]|uniref:hypothetical protein n=1 Tax=Parasediminibacterium sp. JCM 36343 TaxID=3374279 RepID=UPI003979B2B6
MERKLRIPDPIIKLVVKECGIRKKKFSFAVLRKSINEFIKADLKAIDIVLFEHYETTQPSVDTYTRAFGEAPPKYVAHGSNMLLIDLLCYYATKESWPVLSKKLGLSEDDLLVKEPLSIIAAQSSFKPDNNVDKKRIKKNTHLYNDILIFGDRLKFLYNENQIQVGVDEANAGYTKFKSLLNLYPAILNRIFKFNMRNKRYEKVRKIIDEISKKELSDKVITCCKLALCECEIRQAYSAYQLHPKAQIEKILLAKEILEAVPETQHMYPDYLYWNGRCDLDFWYATNGTDPADLRLSLHWFDKALVECYTWWSHFYKCIILKLQKKHIILQNELKIFTIEIIKESEKFPKKSSLRTFRIALYLFNNDPIGLEKFLEESKNSIVTSNSESTIYYHNKLIFYNERENRDMYRKILEKWI